MLYPIQNDLRSKLDLSGLWDFQADPDERGEAAGWFTGLPTPRPMAVPGSWNEQYADLYDYFGLGWYLTRTYLPGGWQGQRIFLRVGSAIYAATVYINGVEAGRHEGGHLPFAIEITGRLRWEAENTIAIAVENKLLPSRVPPSGAGQPPVAGYPATSYDFYPFSGLDRPVVLYTVPQTFIQDITVASALGDGGASLAVTVRTEGEPTLGRLRLAGAGQAVEAGLTFAGGAAEARLTLPKARLWSPEDPFLYDLEVTTQDGSGDDHYALKVGVRTVEVQGHQILLNGQPVRLRGFGRHEDFFASGRSLNLPLLVKDYQLLRWVGANSYRTSHYPYSEEEMQLADREGFLIIDEIPAVGLRFDDPPYVAERLRAALQQVDELVRRDKNHPSVIMWSVANEPVPHDLPARLADPGARDPSDAEGKSFLDALLSQARQLDPTRPVTLVSLSGTPPEWLEACDIICANRYYGWYFYPGEPGRGLAALDADLEALWYRYRRPVILTEFGADAVAGMHAQPPLMWTEEYQADLIRGTLALADGKPFVAGTHVWNFADFAAAQGTGRVAGMNLKGVFTRARQPKLAAHALRALWGKTG